MKTEWIIFIVFLAVAVALQIHSVRAHLKMIVCNRKKRTELIENRQKLSPIWQKAAIQIVHAKEQIKEYEKESVEITTDDGLKLLGNIYYASEKTNSFICCVHGYMTNSVNEFSAYIPYYHDMGYNVLTYDSRGQGKSDGKYITFGYKEKNDCISWCDYITERFGKASKILLHGISMGASTVLMAYGTNRLPKTVCGIVADCGYKDAMSIFAYVIRRDSHIGKFPILYMINLSNILYCRFDYRECSAIKALKNAERSIPILFIHGKKDYFVPVKMAHELYDACTSEKELLIVDGATHETSFFVDRKAVCLKIEKELEKAGMLRNN